MRTTSVTISRGATVNLGQRTFEGQRFDVSITNELEWGDTISNLIPATIAQVNKELAAQIEVAPRCKSRAKDFVEGYDDDDEIPF